jgi:hypothetical protein
MRRSLATALAIGLAGNFALLRLAPAWFLTAPPRGLFFCAEPGMNPTQPSMIHFEPGLVEHNNWIEFPVRTDPMPNMWGLCVDGRGIANEPAFVQGNIARFNLQTRFVNLLWLANRLDDYAQPEHWKLTYATCRRGLDGSLTCV